jgi:predicted lipid carrier protein YhbT
MLYEERHIQHQLEQGIKSVIDIYTESDYHTNAGKWLRLVVKFIPLNFIIKLAQAKIK